MPGARLAHVDECERGCLNGKPSKPLVLHSGVVVQRDRAQSSLASYTLCLLHFQVIGCVVSFHGSDGVTGGLTLTQKVAGRCVVVVYDSSLLRFND